MHRVKFYAPLIAVLGLVFWHSSAFAANPSYDVRILSRYNSAAGNKFQLIHPPAGITYTEFQLHNIVASSSDRSLVFKIAATSTFGYDFTNWNILGQADLKIPAGSTEGTASSSGNTVFPLITDGSYYLLWEETTVTNLQPNGGPIAENTSIAGDSEARALDMDSAPILNEVPGIAPIQTDFSLVNTTQSSLEWVYPTNNITTVDFPTWYLNAVNASSSDSRLIIDFGNSSSSLFLHDVFNNIPNTTYLLQASKGYILPLGTWWADAKLSDQTTGHTIADAGLISFTIVSATSSLFTTTTVSCIAPSSTLDVGGWVVFGLCGLFSPSQGSQTALKNLGTELQGKAPWGYITAATNAINGLTNTSSTASSSIAEIGATFSGFLGPLRDLLALLLWGSFGFWIVNRLKHVHT